MKKNSLKLAQKGGMMIEALAMLGLIAVVTPTMYKKSAERTLEVEDINTATTMRSVMAAADSYVSSHYGELVQEMTTSETNKKTKKLNLDDLKPYLPYGFNADKLYDFDKPQVSVVRNGNNLTAFVLFPAKEDGENGLGQERTVRIATLVGANGGYVNGDQTAKGIGGIWNLKKPDFQAVFGSTDASKPEVYSIVTASTDAINNTNTEEDSDKFLYRTADDGIWHNTMRADLYMGGNFNEHDGYDRSDPKSQPFSIRNVKSMIVGAATASDENTYGLYINGGTDNTNDAAFIKGSLEAAIPDGGVANFKATKDTIEADQGRFRIAENVLSYVGDIDLANGSDEDWNSVKIGKLGFLYTPLKLDRDNPHYLINGDYRYGEQASLSFIDRNVFSIEAANENNDNIVINRDGIKGPGEDGWTEEEYGKKMIKYSNAPKFPVRIGSNAKVDGILATSQLDTQNIRAATLEVGSANIDDDNKWLNVDAGGIRVRDTNSAKDSDIDEDGVGTFIDVNDWRVKLKVSQVGEGAYLNLQKNDPGDGNDAILHADKIDINSGEAYLYLQNNTDAGGDGKEAILHADKIDIKNNTIQQQIKDNDVVFSSLQDSGYSTNVKIQKTNFQVSDTDGDNVLTVRGNNEGWDLDSFLNMGVWGDAFDVSVRGETIFAPKSFPEDKFFGYLSVGLPYIEPMGPEGDYAGVSIAPFKRDGQIFPTMAVDLSPDSDISYNGNGAISEQNIISPGTVYVRNGMVEVLPTTEDWDWGPSTKGAHEGHGFMAAGRFVANNPNPDGNGLITVPKFFEGSDYTDYNGSSDDSGRYDTYMVNPAYTSVMHDIKLTTRGGARLSDILPDFINKGIYITSNTYLDNIQSMSFKFNGTEVVPASGNATSSQSTITIGSENSWASPYLGFVPAPQCPPGYNRVITMAPQSFMMAQAGQMQRGSNPRLGTDGAYYVKNQVPDSTAFDHYTDTVTQNGAYVQQAFVKPSVSENSDVTINGTTYSDAAKTHGLEIIGTSGAPQTATYFLASFGDQTVPLTIQQSTWLKTNVIPVDNSGASYSIGADNGDYTIGWAALMGFVYDAATYRTVIDKLSGDISYNEGNNNVYWNVFPVRRNTLEAYATTYCYFDRNNIGDNWNTSSDFTSDKYIDHYNALTDYGNYTEEKNSKASYKKRLNDPAMKYDEVW